MKTIDYYGEKIKLPHYRQDKKCVFKIFEDGTCMYARFNDGVPKLGSCSIDDVFEGTKECTYSEFIEKHKQVRDYITEMDLFFK